MNLSKIFIFNLLLNLILISSIIFFENYFYYIFLFGIIIFSIILKNEKNLRYFILLNFFILFYFSYSKISFLIKEIFEINLNFIFIFIYTLFIIFLFSKLMNFNPNFKKLEFKKVKKIIYYSIFFSFIFIFTYEKIPQFLYEYNGIISIFFISLFMGFFIALTEQLIFINLFLKTYEKLNVKNHLLNINIISIFFVIFHILKIDSLLEHYKNIFEELYFITLILYLIALFIFYKFSFKIYKKYNNISYCVLLHFIVDFILIFVFLNIG